jgi:hypothetical protein
MNYRISGVGNGWTLYQIKDNQAKPIYHSTDRSKVINKRDQMARNERKGIKK